jgi:hypothetical protein
MRFLWRNGSSIETFQFINCLLILFRAIREEADLFCSDSIILKKNTFETGKVFYDLFLLDFKGGWKA